MDHLHWPLSVLGKAIHHKNLSAAANHIGLSQPQLSRLIAKLEDELGVVLLDRSARRKSGWTPVAFRVAEIYFKSSRTLQVQLQELKAGDQLQHLNVGTLEGLIPLSTEVCHSLFQQSKISVIELNVYDLSELEEHFERGEIDLAFTCREPGRSKFKNIKQIGWQDLTIENDHKNNPLRVLSPFEYANLIQSGKRNAPRRERVEAERSRIVISNSLASRRNFIDQHGARGQVPSVVHATRPGSKTEQPVYILGNEILPRALWEKVQLIPVSIAE